MLAFKRIWAWLSTAPLTLSYASVHIRTLPGVDNFWTDNIMWSKKMY